MAVGSSSKAAEPKAAPAKAEESPIAAQVPVGVPARQDTVDPSKAPDPASLDPDADRVAIVSRDVNGEPLQSRNYTVLVHPDAPQAEKDAANNLAGQAQGAQYVKAED